MSGSGSGGIVCLQGGAELGPDCRAMDAEVLRRSGAGPVVVVALAAQPGHEHDTTVAEAVAYYSSLGAAQVRGAPDARIDPVGARAAVADAGLVVLPGGSPSRLLTGLRESGVDDVLREVLAAGSAVSGASAGAMVLCAWTVLPEGEAPHLVAGLGVVPRSLVLPHYAGASRWSDALRTLPPDVVVLGLPECAGVLVDGPGRSSLTAVGVAPTTVTGGRALTLDVGSTTAL